MNLKCLSNFKWEAICPKLFGKMRGILHRNFHLTLSTFLTFKLSKNHFPKELFSIKATFACLKFFFKTFQNILLSNHRLKNAFTTNVSTHADLLDLSKSLNVRSLHNNCPSWTVSSLNPIELKSLSRFRACV